MKEQTPNNSENTKIGIYQEREIDYETALEITGFGKYHIYLTLASGLGLFSAISTVYGIGYVLPAAECDLNLNATDKGLLASVGIVGIILTLYIWGALADTIGRKKVILVSLIGTFITSVAAVLTPSFWLFATFLFLNGVFISGSSCTLFAYLGEFHTNKRRSGAIAWCTVLMNSALTLLPVAAWIIISQTFSFDIFNFTFLPWRLFILLCNTPALLATIVIAPFPESPKYLILKGELPKAINILKRMYSVNLNQSADTFPVQPLSESTTTNLSRNKPYKSPINVLKSIWFQTIPLFQREHRKYTMITCFLQFGAFAISSGLLLWYPDILHKLSESYKRYPNSSFTICEAITFENSQATNHDCDNKTIDFVVYQQNIIIGIAYCIGCSVVGLLIDSIGKRVLMVANLLVPALCCIILTFVTSSLAVDILFLIVLVPPGLCVAVITSVVVDIFPTQFKAIAVSLCMLMGRLGSVVATTGIGYLFEFSCNGTFYIYAALILGCVFLSLLIPNKRYSTS